MDILLHYHVMFLKLLPHYSDVIMSAMASQITGVSIVSSTVCSGADQIKYQSSASLDSVRKNHRWPLDSPHKGPVRRKMFPFDDVIIFPISSRFTTTSFLVAISFSLHRCLFFIPSTVPPNNAECNGLRNLMHIPFHCQLLFLKFKFLPSYRQFFPLQGHFLPH